jgi:predicted metal-dependent hydrolase
MTESIVVGDLMFLLHRSSKRKTIGITVERNGELVLAVPSNFPVDQVEGIAQEKLFWIYRKLAEKEMLQKPVKPKEYVSGEGFYYLGKSYRLLITDSNSEDAGIPALNLNRGRFMLSR